MSKRANGFTLIELMIVVAVLAIIIALGYPSYRDQVMKARRTEAMGELLELADRLERYYADQGTYAGATLGGAESDIYPTTTEGGYYTLSITAQDNVAFSLQAVPVAGRSQAKDKCDTFTITSLGVKGVSGGSLAVKDCWK
jgi:type IV pilus assembly protein PilE